MNALSASLLIVSSCCANGFVREWWPLLGSNRRLNSIRFSSDPIENVHALNDKDAFLRSLNDLSTLCQCSKERTQLLNKLIKNKMVVPSISTLKNRYTRGSKSASIAKPGSWKSFHPVAPGTWIVIYAPHMTTMANFLGGAFHVEYHINDDGTMESHARYHFPIIGEGYLSVSGTYSSVTDTFCRVDFDEAWVKLLPRVEENGTDISDEPYKTIDDVPASWSKSISRRLGRLLFFNEVSHFPVLFLDEDLIVFDFELLGTRICARKVQ